MRIQFLGATGTVTGSKYLLSAGDSRILVECGLFQGHRQLRLRNREALPIQSSAVEAVVLTHAHLDHSGYIPRLVRAGFSGKIYCSEATYDLCEILLPDSGRIQEEDAAFANRRGSSIHPPALPLYTEEDAHRALKYFSPVQFGKRFHVAGRVHAEMARAGHILGAAIVTVNDGARTITFSGDLGRFHDPLMVAPSRIARTEFLVVESTYGNRLHETSDTQLQLGNIIRDTAARGGVVVIPAFAVGRAQSLLFYMQQLKESGAISPSLPIYLDSPMAKSATSVYRKHLADHRLSARQCAAMCDSATIINTVDESRELDLKQLPKVIISASGMASGGRVLYHLKAFASDPRNTILFPGYQAPGTRGCAMISGADWVMIHGQQVRLRAQVVQIDSLSAHADSGEILGWLSGFDVAPKLTFITHGEPDAADALCQRITDALKWTCRVPEYLEHVRL
jgi:metallo-beta-lactamase family protein